MRADRLLSLLLLLQARGRMTAQELAAELEVSQRTVYRDIDALSAAGVPVFGERGPQGGYALLDGYRTSLTGLNHDEMRAFFMLSVPAPLADLGVGQEAKAALLKVSAALSATGRRDEEHVRQRVHLDATWWHQGGAALPHLRTIQDAIWSDRRLRIWYTLPQGIGIVQTVDAYGLVAKAGVWYLVCAAGGRPRAQRVSDLRDVAMTDEPFTRPADFHLARFWQEWCAEVESRQTRYRVRVRVAPHAVACLPHLLGMHVGDGEGQAGPADAMGWRTAELAFESLEEARSRILGCGGAVEVLEPEALRLSIADYARQIARLYGDTCA